MSSFVPRHFWKPFAIAAALIFLYATVLVKLGSDWWTDPNYSHGLLIPFIIGYILWTERQRLLDAPRRPAFMMGGAGVIAALFLLWTGTAGAELYAQRLSLVLMLAAIAVYFWGRTILRFLVVPLALLWLAMPIPAIIFNKIAFPLQLFASRCAVWAMRLFDIPVLREGNVIELMPLGSSHTKKLEVVEACSGIRSLMTLVTLAVVFAYFTYPKPNGAGTGGGRWRARLTSYGFWRSLVVVLAALPVAIVTNAARVSGTGILAHYYGTEIADGFFHSFSGWVMYIIAFLLLFSIGWLLDHIAGRRKGRRDTEQELAKAGPSGETPTVGGAARTAVSAKAGGLK